MATLRAKDSHLADASGDPLIGERQANVADAAAITGTAIAAVVPSAPPNVDEDGITAGAFITRAARRTQVTAVLDLITWATEMDLDYTALLADLTAIRTQQTLILNVLEEHGLMTAS